MAVFSSYQNTLPDPNNGVSASGSAGTGDAGYVAGPGYSSVSLKSVFPSQTTRTNSGSVIVRNIAGHKWDINISYNPLLRAQFEPMYAFLLQKKGSVSHFFVSLPQYKQSQNAAWNTYLTTGNSGGVQTVKPSANVLAGADKFIFTNNGGTAFNSSTMASGKPGVGDLFNIVDSNDTNHSKVYMITRVSTRVDYLSGSQPDADEFGIEFTPPLRKAVNAATSTVNFTDVKFRVINKGKDISYSLDVNNLYKLSLNVEEAQP